MGFHLTESTKILAWKHAELVFALLALVGASSAMAIPGPAGEITGFSAVLLVAALALMAGHIWAVVILAVAQLLLVGKIFPIAFEALQNGSGDWASIAPNLALLACLPGLVLFLATLPFIVEVIVGDKDTAMQKPGEWASKSAALLWLLQPLWH